MDRTDLHGVDGQATISNLILKATWQDQRFSHRGDTSTQGCRMPQNPPLSFSLPNSHLPKCFSVSSFASPGNPFSPPSSPNPTQPLTVTFFLTKARAAASLLSCTPATSPTKPFLNDPQTRRTSSDGSCTGP